MRKTLFVLLGLLAVVTAAAGAQQRNAVRFGRDLVIAQGTTVYDAVAVGGNLTVNGTVQHDAVSVGGSVTLNEGATVGHNAVAVGGRIIESTGTRVGGDMVEVGGGRHGFSRDIQAFFAVVGLLTLISFLVLGALIAAIFPKEVAAVSLVVEKEAAQAGLWGIVGVMLIVPVALLLAVTVVGIMLIPLELVLVAVAMLVGYVSVAALVGKKIIEALKRKWPLVAETLLGMVLLGIAGFIPILGWMVTLLALLFGFGAVLYALLRRRPEKQNPGVISA